MVLTKAFVLEGKGKMALRDMEVNDALGDDDCRIQVHSVGICGSDVHYVEHGGIGPFVVKEPMILGHEASGTVVAVGKNVKNVKIGDRVAMEPGIPRWTSTQTLKGMYNLDPEVVFFATPPVHGCMSTTVIHPGPLCFKLPDNMTFGEGAMCEPVAVGLYSATKAGIQPGDVALVIGAGTIGMCTALSALAGGCSDVIITDVSPERLSTAAKYPGLHPILSTKADEVKAMVDKLTSGEGVDRVFECSGAGAAYQQIYDYSAPGATCVLVGMPIKPVPIDVVSSQAKEITFQTIFRYRNVYPKAIRLISSGRMNVKPLISAKFPFAQSQKAYDRALEHRPTDVKIMIEVDSNKPAKL